MSIDDTQPENRNYLSPLNYRFLIKKSPNVNFFVQKITVPGINAPSTGYPNPFVKIPVPGEHLEYQPLEITFKVDEDLADYREIHKWIKLLGKPKNFDEYAKINKVPLETGEGKFSDITVMILTGNKRPNYEFLFVDAFPVYLSDMEFNTTDSDVNYISATARFLYTYYDINKINA